ncbi:MAG: RNA 2',3'-cyclic phosphodiesterase [Janthinobacterium lividum]
MNHFFALKLSKEAEQTVCQSAEEWHGLVTEAKWYEPEDYHITLKFLGNIDGAKQPGLIEAANQVAAETLPVTISAASYGGFPDMRAPSVLWAGILISPELDRLASHLDQAMAGLGFRADHRKYQPHITVARCRLGNKASQKRPLPSERLFAPFIVDQFVLMQTSLTGERANGPKARYNIVHTFPFGNAHSSDVS